MSRYMRRGPIEVLAGRFYTDLGRDHRDTVFVAGSGRSGTTWLATELASRLRARFLFEPFDPERTPSLKHMPHKLYITPEDAANVFSETAGKVLSGDVSGPWVDRFNRRFVSRRRVVKDIRTNLLLGWMKHRFPEMPVVFMLRDPVDVVGSRLRLGWRNRLREVAMQSRLVEEHLRPLKERILAVERDGTPFERELCLWCVENYVPLRQMSAGILTALPVFYEDLVADMETEVRHVLDYLEGCDPCKPVSRRPLPEVREPDPDASDLLEAFGLDGLYPVSPVYAANSGRGRSGV